VAEVFVEQVLRSAASKVLLVLDNNDYLKNIRVLHHGTEKTVPFLSFAPHKTQKMQSLGMSEHQTLKQRFEQFLFYK
jgi:hypothetical protein